MSNPVTNEEVEDVLSSIRRLVSEDKRPIARKIEDPGGERLVLTPAHRIAGVDRFDADDNVEEHVAATETQQADDHPEKEPDDAQDDVEAHGTSQGDSVAEDSSAEADALKDSVNNDANANEVKRSERLDSADDFEERLHREIEDALNEPVKDEGHEDDVASTDAATVELNVDSSDIETSESTSSENTPDERMSEAANDNTDADNTGNDSTGADKNEDISDYLWSDRRREDFLPAKHAGFHGTSPEPTEINETASQSEGPDVSEDASSDTFTLSQAEADAVLSASTEDNLNFPTVDDVAGSPEIDGSSAEETNLEDVVEDEVAEQDDRDASVSDDAPEDIEASQDSPVDAALGSKIEALESAVGRISTDWEPDDAGTDDYSGTKAPAMEWKDNVDLDAKGTPVIDEATEIVAPEDVEDAEDIEEDAEEEQSREDALAQAPELRASADVSDAPDILEAGGAPLSAFVSRRPASDPETEPFPADEQYVDEEMLRELVGDIVRSELQGVLGERITRNVRKLVRREIQRALAAQNLD